MTVCLHRSDDAPDAEAFDRWVAIGTAENGHRRDKEMPDIAASLEAAFERCAEEWLRLGNEMGKDPSSVLSHTAACAANISDFGEMLAWSDLVRRWSLDDERTLVVCDDPWLFRHLARCDGVASGRKPPLHFRAIHLFVRGYAARLKCAADVSLSTLRLRRQRRMFATGGAYLLVYGHPNSNAQGDDAYFGDLLARFPSVKRALHVDCRPDLAHALAQGGRTTSLHAWGRVGRAVTLVAARWRPRRALRTGPFEWLVRRAAAREGGTGQAAMIRWQIDCQRAWLAATRPRIVVWPWENHAWERQFVRDARRLGISTLGYQHSVIGRHMLNYATGSNPDGIGSLPDAVFCTGPGTRDRLRSWGVPDERIRIGGALRFADRSAPECDPKGPVFVALPFDHVIATEMLAAIEACAGPTRSFLVRDHPMTPFPIRSQGAIRRADGPLSRQRTVSAVIYAATTVGLEALLAGIPALRFRSPRTVALDILPDDLHAEPVEAGTLGFALDHLTPPPAIDRGNVFAPIDHELWRERLEPD